MANKKNHIDLQETDESSFNDAIPDAHYRLINTDGSFNINRKGGILSSKYEAFLEMKWSYLFMFFVFFYFVINTFFGFIFKLLGPHNINGLRPGTWLEEFIQYIYFSIQTFTTVGYGHLTPIGIPTNILAAFVAFIGLLSFALATGIFYAKFSMPVSHILFSDHMLIAPNKEKKKSLQFRVVNSTNNQVIDLSVRVTLAWLENVNGTLRRKFKRLELEIDSIHLFPLNWTIVHPIGPNSPLVNMTLEDMQKCKMEVLILIKGFDMTYAQLIHSKQSYNYSDIIANAEFAPMYHNVNGHTELDLEKLNDYIEYIFDSN